MAGKATVDSVDDEDDDVEASAATSFDDGDDDHITVSLEMVVERTTVSLGIVEHIAVHITMSLEMVVGHITASLGCRSTSQCPGWWRHTSQCPLGWWWSTSLCPWGRGVVEHITVSLGWGCIL